MRQPERARSLEMSRTAPVFVALSKRLVDCGKSKELRAQVAGRSRIRRAALGILIAPEAVVVVFASE